MTDQKSDRQDEDGRCSVCGRLRDAHIVGSQGACGRFTARDDAEGADDGATEDALTKLLDETWPDGHRAAARKILSRFSISPAVAAEPVAWTVRRASKPADEDYSADMYWEVLLPDGTWDQCVAVDADDARKTMQESRAEKEPAIFPPPVRGDREIDKTKFYAALSSRLANDMIDIVWQAVQEAGQ